MKKYIVVVLSIMVFISCNSTDEGKNSDALGDNEVIISKYVNEQPQIIREFEEKDGLRIYVYEKEYYEDGNLLKEGALKDNKRHGIWKSYYRDGTKWSEGEFVNGKMEGSTTTYHPNGQVRYTGTFENGKKAGEWRFYDEDGELLEIQFFQPEPIE
jgi:antitoxin component YwqK of YwqJK toxin-antitoxin module